jgi:hypothetical protein
MQLCTGAVHLILTQGLVAAAQKHSAGSTAGGISLAQGFKTLPLPALASVLFPALITCLLSRLPRLRQQDGHAGVPASGRQQASARKTAERLLSGLHEAAGGAPALRRPEPSTPAHLYTGAGGGNDAKAGGQTGRAGGATPALEEPGRPPVSADLFGGDDGAGTEPDAAPTTLKLQPGISGVSQQPAQPRLASGAGGDVAQGVSCTAAGPRGGRGAAALAAAAAAAAAVGSGGHRGGGEPSKLVVARVFMDRMVVDQERLARLAHPQGEPMLQASASRPPAGRGLNCNQGQHEGGGGGGGDTLQQADQQGGTTGRQQGPPYTLDLSNVFAAIRQGAETPATPSTYLYNSPMRHVTVGIKVGRRGRAARGCRLPTKWCIELLYVQSRRLLLWGISQN